MNDAPIILGIETSCDETACAVVRGGRDVLASVVASQVDLHARYGGVVPELASRAHIEAINGLIDRALADAAVRPAELAAIAVTHEPGLIGSLLVGVMAAKTLAWAWGRPLVAVNHVHAHAYAPALDAEPIAYPATALIASGGHTALYRCDGPLELTLLGTTRDDAAGEAFDKVAGILHLGYPGGPAIQRAAEGGSPAAVKLPRSLQNDPSLDVSFSGLKTAVLYQVNGQPGGSERPRRRQRAGARRAAAQPHAGQGIESFTAQEVADLAASFQAAVVDVLRAKLRRAARQLGARSLIVGGGVSANAALRAAAAEEANALGCTLRLPALAYCIDNAAMVAGLAFHKLRAHQTADLNLAARATVGR